MAGAAVIGLSALQWRLIKMGAIALVAGVLIWRVSSWRNGYLERDQAVADLAAYKGAVAEREEQAARDRAADEARRKLLSMRLEEARGELADLRASPIVSVVYREKTVNGHSCPDPRIGPDWIGVYNDTADIATRAVSAPN